MKWWAIGVAVIGAAATIAVTGLLWMLMTQPVTVAQALARGL